MSGFELTLSSAFSQAVRTELFSLASVYQIQPRSDRITRHPDGFDGLPDPDILYELAPTTINYPPNNVGERISNPGIKLTETRWYDISDERGWLGHTGGIPPKKLALYGTVRQVTMLTYAADLRQPNNHIAQQRSAFLFGLRIERGDDGEDRQKQDMLIQVSGPTRPEEVIVAGDPAVRRDEELSLEVNPILSAAQEKIDAEHLVEAIWAFRGVPVGLIALLDTIRDPVYPRREAPGN